MKMGLLYGENKIVYSVESELQGKQTLQGRIFFWDQEGLQIVISDIDGTITRSDVMGHVMTFLKKDWTHKGIARLYCRFESQGHKMVYVTARPVSQVSILGLRRGIVSIEVFIHTEIHGKSFSRRIQIAKRTDSYVTWLSHWFCQTRSRFQNAWGY